MPPIGGQRYSMSVSYGAQEAAFQPRDGQFSPGLPIQPIRPQPVRTFDFAVGANTTQTPRSSEVFSFHELASFSNVEAVRLAIETVKDQFERLEWRIKPVHGAPGSGEDDPRILELTRLFRRPDGRRPFRRWLRRLLEDLLVYDAPAIEKRRDRGGRLIGLDVVPGRTIKLLVDETGREPAAPIPAYQQIIKGQVWNLLTTDDLIYAPRNPRPDFLYGFSPVEQVVVTINTLIRRQAVQLGYFTESNVPAGILNAPNGWSADTIMTMQDAWDLRTAHPTSDRSKLVWVPEGTRYQPFKDAPLKDEFDEWLYRVICYAFSVPPSPFVKQMNFATAGQADDQGKEEGISGRKLWWKEVADAVIQHDFGFEDLEWAWIAEQDIDPDTQNTIDDRDLRNGSRTLDEVRHRRGLPPLPDGQGAVARVYTGSGAVGFAEAKPPG